jgi:hypothetical protein
MGDSMASSILIANYKIELRRTMGDGSYVRAIKIELEPTDELYKTVLLVFFEENPSKLGTQCPAEGSVVITLPTKDFDTLYHIIQTEAPVFVDWLADDEHEIKSFSLRTHEEPLGEGPADVDFIPLNRKKDP